MSRYGSALVLICLLFLHGQSKAELYFYLDALNLNEKDRVNMASLASVDDEIASSYYADIWVNQVFWGQKLIEFNVANNSLIPAFTLADLHALGIKTQEIKALQRYKETDVIDNVTQLIPGASFHFDSDRLKLSLSVPQKFFDKEALGTIAYSEWDDGITAFYTNYYATGFNGYYKNAPNVNNQYVNLTNGLNIGAWRFKHSGYYSNSNGEKKWENNHYFAQRDIKGLHSRLFLGKTTSPSIIYTPFLFKGASLSSQDEMLSSSIQGFAPRITGIAFSNATVEIRHNGYLIYQTVVSPGPFDISDLNSLSGEIEVTILEEDGSIRRFYESFSSLPIMVRKGHMKYSVSLGQYESNYLASGEGSRFVQIESIYGVLNNSTLYGGAIVSNDYQNYIIGLGQGMGVLGSLSFDVSFSGADIDDKKKNGTSYQLKYDKKFSRVGTSLVVSGYRFSNENYLDFDDFNYANYENNRYRTEPQKQRVQLSINQPIGALGTFSLSGYQQNYWNSDKKLTYYSANWTKSFSYANVNMGYSHNVYSNHDSENVVSANVSFPLSQWTSIAKPIYLNTNFTQSNQQNTRFNTSVNGLALEDNRLHYSVSHSYQKIGVNSRTAPRSR